MRRDMSSCLCAVMLLIGVAAGTDAQDLGKRPLRRPPPRSLFEMLGVHASATPDSELAEAARAGKTLSTGVDVSGAPAGTERMYVYRNLTDHCVNGAVYPSFATVFDHTFTTGPGTRYLQVVYTTQANISDSSFVDGLAIQCRVTQGATTVVCSNTEFLPFLLARNTGGQGNSLVTTYAGFVTADPDTLTRVQIEVAVGDVTTQASACANNLIVRY